MNGLLWFGVCLCQVAFQNYAVFALLYYLLLRGDLGWLYVGMALPPGIVLLALPTLLLRGLIRQVRKTVAPVAGVAAPSALLWSIILYGLTTVLGVLLAPVLEIFDVGLWSLRGRVYGVLALLCFLAMSLLPVWLFVIPLRRYRRALQSALR
ncbi:hypothetical protein [Pseudomonas sp. NPDC007930]|uniref:hypothetical protein n=1 Tax=Pseudomonas sp. NPDC007930 TaxID=3364417 RepID=UPI0036E8812C